MGKVLAYIRASTDKQDLNHQKLEILELTRKKSMQVDDFIEITISSKKTSKHVSGGAKARIDGEVIWG